MGIRKKHIKSFLPTVIINFIITILFLLGGSSIEAIFLFLGILNVILYLLCLLNVETYNNLLVELNAIQLFNQFNKEKYSKTVYKETNYYSLLITGLMLFILSFIF